MIRDCSDYFVNDKMPAAELHTYVYEVWRDNAKRLSVSLSTDSYEVSDHFHSCVEFMYVEHGVMHVTIDNVEHTLTERQLVIIPSLAMHSVRAEDNTRRWLLIIPREMQGALAHTLDCQTFAKTVIEDDSEHMLLAHFHQIFNAAKLRGIYASMERGSEAHQSILSLLAAAFLSTVISITGLKEVSRSTLLIMDALKYIHLHFREPIRVPELARHLLCYQQLLSDQFSKALGTTIVGYINHIRAIDVKYNLATNPDLTLEQAAALSGFGSVRSMLRAYRQEYGCTPTENRT